MKRQKLPSHTDSRSPGVQGCPNISANGINRFPFGTALGRLRENVFPYDCKIASRSAMITPGERGNLFFLRVLGGLLHPWRVSFLMPQRIAALSNMLQSPPRILALMLLVVFVVEVGVMTMLPFFVPGSLSDTGRAFVDAALLTIVCAPVIWWLIVGPLRRIAVQEHARSEMIVANANEGIVTVNALGMVTSANRAACELFKTDCRFLIGHPFSNVVQGVELSEENVQTQAIGTRQDQSNFPLRVSMSLSPAETEASYIAILQDLTESQRLEEQKVQVAREREAMRTQQMATLAQLATGVAHEIRNPLTSIKMLIQVNCDKFAEQGLATEDLELVVQEIRRMERSVNGLLEYGRPEKSERARFCIEDVISKTERLIRGRCEETGVSIVVDIANRNCALWGDANQIQQLLLNLSLNAIDAMPTGGTISFKAKTDEQMLLVEVSDTGPGIDLEIMENLFAPFVTTKRNGVGLGLGICRRIAEAHSGTLEAFNRMDGGATFRLTIPMGLPADDIGTNSPGGPNIQSPKVV